MSVTGRVKRGCAVGLPLVAVGLVTTIPKPLRTEPEIPSADQFGHALAAREATIAELLRRLDELEVSVLLADLLRRAGTL